MNRFKTSALVAAVIGVLTPHTYGVFFFFPAFDSNDNLINPVNRPIITSGVTQIGIGFMEDTSAPNSIPFPSESPDPTTVNLVAGGVFPATVTGGVTIANQSTLNVSGGMIASIPVSVFDTSSVSLSSGSVQGLVSLQNNSALTMSGGTLGSVEADTNSTATVSGGAVTNTLTAFQQGVITISGGTIGGSVASQLTAGDGGTINITGGNTSGGPVSASASGLNSMISITSPVTLQNVSALDAGSLSMQSGTIQGNVTTTIDSLGGGLSPPSLTLGAVQVNGSVNVGAGTNMTLGAGTTVAGTVAVGTNANLVTSATIGPLNLASNCSITMNGGSVTEADLSTSNGSITFNGGTEFFNLFTNNGMIVVTGGVVGQDVTAFDSGKIEVDGGTINGSVITEGSSTALLLGGTVGEDAIAGVQSTIGIFGATIGIDAAATGSGTINMESGTIAGNLTAEDQAFVNMDGGIVSGNLMVTNSGIATIKGGLVSGSLSVINSGSAVMNSGAVMGGATTDNSSNLNINGGSIAGAVSALTSSKIFIFGGFMGSGVSAANNSAILIDGLQGNITITGQVVANDNSMISIGEATILGGVLATGSSTVTLNYPGPTIVGPIQATQGAHLDFESIDSMGSGSPSPAADRLSLVAADSPTPINEIFLYDDATLEIDGLTFNANLIDPMNDNGMFSEYELTGTLGDGSSLPDGLTLFVANGSGASFQFVAVPEPGATALVLGALAPALLGRRRRPGSSRSRHA